jgi:hypothetical protein
MPRVAKKPKDPNAPKRPMSSYFLFSNERRAVMRKEMPEKKLTELSKLISVEWKELADDTKATYKKRWEDAKSEYAIVLGEYKLTENYEKYQQKLKAWKAEKDGCVDSDSDDGAPAKVTLPKKPKDTNAPKRSKTSYFLFLDSVRAQTKAEHPNLSTTETAKLLGAKWKAMSDAEKAPFSAKAKALKAAYAEDVERYKKTDDAEAFAREMDEWKAKCEKLKKMAAKKNGKSSAKKSKGKRSKAVEVEVDDSSEEEESSEGSESEEESEEGSSSEEESSEEESSSVDS